MPSYGDNLEQVISSIQPNARPVSMADRVARLEEQVLELRRLIERHPTKKSPTGLGEE